MRSEKISRNPDLGWAVRRSAYAAYVLCFINGLLILPVLANAALVERWKADNWNGLPVSDQARNAYGSSSYARNAEESCRIYAELLNVTEGLEKAPQPPASHYVFSHLTPQIEHVTYLCRFTWSYNGVDQGLHFGSAATLKTSVGCGSPFSYYVEQNQCRAYCNTSETWDSDNERCVASPEAQRCASQTSAPIELFQGKKYRSEMVIESGIRYPFSLTYFYNNQRNQERTPTGGRMAVVTGDRYLAAMKSPVTASEYQTIFTNLGVPSNSGFYRATQHYGSLDQYWRHSFDEILQIYGSQYIFQFAKGYEASFTSFGASAAYPHLQLQALAAGEESFAGYKLTDNKTGEVKKFNSDGQLMKIERGPQDELLLMYDSQNRLDKITNSEGAYIQLAYQDLATDSIYSVTSTNRSYPISATNNRGESAQITWGKTYQGKTAKFHLITQITEATSGPAQSARTFEYNDPRWPASITDQYFVADLSNSTNRRQTLHFEYDDLGRAVFSGLTGKSSDAVTYVDPNTRTVTNALGKQATYTFADFNGVKRLQSVTGEPTQNCVSSEVIYEYDTNGNVQRKIQNGQVTEYQYDTQNRETSRTEAAGTPQARTITTEYHPTLNKPARIIEPGLTVEMTYDAEGRLLSTQKIPTP